MSWNTDEELRIDAENAKRREESEITRLRAELNKAQTDAIRAEEAYCEEERSLRAELAARDDIIRRLRDALIGLMPGVRRNVMRGAGDFSDAQLAIAQEALAKPEGGRG